MKNTGTHAFGVKKVLKHTLRPEYSMVQEQRNLIPKKDVNQKGSEKSIK